MVACFDGACIKSDDVCNGENDCVGVKGVDKSEDEFGCPEMQDMDTRSEEGNENAEQDNEIMDVMKMDKML